MTSASVVPSKQKFFNKKHLHHLTQIQAATCEALERKYTAGVEAYKSNLWEMPAMRLAEEAISECVDQITYLMSLRQSLKVICALAHEGMTDLELTNPKARECCQLIYTSLTGDRNKPSEND
jgi:hypothetical protein